MSRKVSATDKMNADVYVFVGGSSMLAARRSNGFMPFSLSLVVWIATVRIYILAIMFTYTADIYCATSWILVVYSRTYSCAFGSTDRGQQRRMRLVESSSPRYF